MKKSLLYFILLCSFSNSFSQEIKENKKEKHPVYLGIRVGANVSNFTHSNLDYKLGSYIGFYFNFKASSVYRPQIEFGYSSQGGKSSTAIDKDLLVNYFTISPVSQFYLNNSGFHFLVFPSIEVDLDDTIFNKDERNGVTDFDLAIGAGFGYTFNSNLTIETRFKHGLIDTDIQIFNNNDTDVYNIVFQLGLSYKFKIKE